MTAVLRDRRSPAHRRGRMEQLRGALDHVMVRDRTDPNAGRVRARQLQAIFSAAPFAAIASVLNAAVLVYILADRMPGWARYGWFAAMLVLLMGTLRSWHNTRESCQATAPPATIETAAGQAALFALAWSVVAIVGLSDSSPYQQAFVAAVTAGMLCGGAFILAVVPAAAYSYVAILGVAAALGLMVSANPYGTVLGILLLNYTAVLMVGIHFMARSFVSRVGAELRTERQRQVIGLLLRDFEEHASDLLWETGPHGHLLRPSARMVDALGVARSRVGDRRFVDWLALGSTPDAGDDVASPERLYALFSSTEPFRDVTVHLPGPDGGRWWSITAKPLIDASGSSAGWRGVLSDVTEARNAHRRLLRMAHHDSLTGLANRARFMAKLEESLADAGEREHCAVLCLDLDGFKSINDSLGHAFGDALLREIGARLRRAVRDEDLVARIGGDEFAVLLRHCMIEADACAIANRILHALDEPVLIGEVTAPVGVSIGIAPVAGHADIASQADQLMVAADLALYAAKAAGKGTWQLYEAEMGSSNRRRHAIEHALRGAIERRELSVHYQAQVGLADWRIARFEALLRWQHPQLGRIPPSEFIPIAEEAGLIDRLGEWVLHEACAEAARWPEHVHVAVNVSPMQAMSGSIATSVDAVLAATGLPPQRLELEITETVFVSEGATAIATLRRLKALGVRIALDDFGTGYSSLAYVRRFPFDTLKIDRAFVHELCTRKDTHAIVNTIVSLARALSIETVAEGVEDASQIRTLREQGCDMIQGFYTSRPVPAEGIADLLAEWPGRATAALGFG
ncbi:MAG: EAL domain-containing protein [Burkholderiaceae bacterium]|nr:EAL domain-containing protein [Burkholderiaceae bacterium]